MWSDWKRSWKGHSGWKIKQRNGGWETDHTEAGGTFQVTGEVGSGQGKEKSS